MGKPQHGLDTHLQPAVWELTGILALWTHRQPSELIGDWSQDPSRHTSPGCSSPSHKILYYMHITCAGLLYTPTTSFEHWHKVGAGWVPRSIASRLTQGESLSVISKAADFSWVSWICRHGWSRRTRLMENQCGQQAVDVEAHCVFATWGRAVVLIFYLFFFLSKWNQPTLCFC